MVTGRESDEAAIVTVETLLEAKMENGRAFVPIDGLWRMSVAQYHAMIAAGVLTEDNPIELLQGWLVQKMPKSPRHTVVTRLLFNRLEALLPSGWFVNMQEPITTEDSEPEPDLTVVRGEPRDYFTYHPHPEQVVLLIEVSDATLNRDRTLKKQLYATAAVPVYWIVNLPDHQIEVYSQPFVGAVEPDYKQRRTYGLDEATPVWIEGELLGDIPVASLFPTSVD
jgi:Uma2 family endonuclease